MKRIRDKFNLLANNQSGFTLIELLIVIVIIGILAGVLIAVIDPTAQQNRARDANVKAIMNKVALATQGYVSSYGSAPNDTQFIGSLTNAAESGAGVCTGGDTVCLFSVTGTPLPATSCAADGYTAGAGQCYFRYDQAGAGLSQFTLRARSFGIASTYFQFSNTGAAASIIQHCTLAGVCTTP